MRRKELETEIVKLKQEARTLKHTQLIERREIGDLDQRVGDLINEVEALRNFIENNLIKPTFKENEKVGEFVITKACADIYATIGNEVFYKCINMLGEEKIMPEKTLLAIKSEL